jgi:hypothetical protein
MDNGSILFHNAVIYLWYQLASIICWCCLYLTSSRCPPSAIQGTIINAPPIGENDHLNENFVDNYSLDADDGGEYTLCQKMVHYCGGHIAVEHLAACKAVLVFQAGCSISKLSSMTKVVKEAAMMELYNASIAALDEIHFGDSARLFFFAVVSKER